MKCFLLGLVAFIVLLAAIGYAFRGKIVMRLMERTVASNLATDLLRELPDGLHVALCGAGSPLPDPDRSDPCAAVIAGSRLYVVDAGAGSSRVQRADTSSVHGSARWSPPARCRVHSGLP